MKNSFRLKNNNNKKYSEENFYYLAFGIEGQFNLKNSKFIF